MKRTASQTAARAPTPDEVFALMAERGYVEEFLKNIGICFKAEKRWWDKDKEEWITEPDYRVRTDVMKILAPLIMPAQRQTIDMNHKNKKDDTTPEQRALEVAKTITSNLPWFLETAKRLTQEQRAKKIEVVDVTPAPEEAEPSFEPVEI